MKITVVGGDARMTAAARMFEDYGFECAEFALDNSDLDMNTALKDAAVAVLPLPCEKGGILNAPTSNERINVGVLIDAAATDTLFIGGKLPIKGENFVDYAEREEYLLLNAIPTAEGAVAIAMNELDITLHGASAFVLGFGRIGAYLTKLLKGFNANVTVAARRTESRTLAEMQGARAVDFESLKSILPSADVVFNTVPHNVMGYRELSAIKQGVPVIDLASGAGGIDADSANALGIRHIHALGLPGRVSPETAGKAVFKTVISILRERGLLK